MHPTLVEYRSCVMYCFRHLQFCPNGDGLRRLAKPSVFVVILVVVIVVVHLLILIFALFGEVFDAPTPGIQHAEDPRLLQPTPARQDPRSKEP